MLTRVIKDSSRLPPPAMCQECSGGSKKTQCAVRRAVSQQYILLWWESRSSTG